MRRERNLRIAVPVLKIGLEAIDTMIRAMDPFGRFVLHALGQGPLMESDLMEATRLEPWQIRRMLEELSRQGCVDFDRDDAGAGEVRPGALVADAPERLAQVDRFNQSSPHILIDRLTGQPLPANLALVRDAGDAALVLPDSVPECEQNEEYAGPVPDDLRAQLPAEGIGFIAGSVESGYVVNYIYKDHLLHAALRGLVERPAPAVGGGPGVGPGPRPAPALLAAPAAVSEAATPSRRIDVPLTGDRPLADKLRWNATIRAPQTIGGLPSVPG